MSRFRRCTFFLRLPLRLPRRHRSDFCHRTANIVVILLFDVTSVAKLHRERCLELFRHCPTEQCANRDSANTISETLFSASEAPRSSPCVGVCVCGCVCARVRFDCSPEVQHSKDAKDDVGSTSFELGPHASSLARDRFAHSWFFLGTRGDLRSKHKLRQFGSCLMYPMFWFYFLKHP